MRRLLGWLALVVIVLAGAGTAWALRHGEIDAIAEASPPDPDEVARGAQLAAVGGCASCHGEDLSGGTALPTPFGTIHSTNITPDRETGLGTWSAEAFRRAMREGVDREGKYLYPAFPYDNFTHATDTDLDAIYAYLQSIPAVPHAPTSNTLGFPYNIRLLLAGWNTLFLTPGPLEPVADQNEVWNRGAYLAESLGHCQACHTPRNAFGAMKTSAAYAGAMVEGWWSPALDGSGTTPAGWSEEELINYFYDGWDANHGIAAGPMAEVVGNVSTLPEEDVTALAVYVASLAGPVAADADRTAAFDTAAQTALASGETPEETGNAVLDHGAEVFVARCVNCHRSGSETVPLAYASAVTGPHPENFLHVVLNGITPTENAYFVRPMPGFAQLPDEDISALAQFVRERFTDGQEWSVTPADVAEIRAE